ncbi:RHS repeat-associated core domain-containing protein [Winogradskyella sp. WHY3]|uniref:RHS repeat-associated core domain-containing protein n=1 Tax=Winogradskyella luteola TaxID=2828330 RepID=A0A9X1FBH6_9FLAO|nr:RHS repeat-associated core domain-containing protein [Winogradskyella luteola]
MVSANVNPVASRFKYNGKELEEALGYDMHEYEARHYDAALGRFVTIDPLAEDYSFQSTYAYAVNDPIRFIDKLGMGPADHYYDEDGNYLGSDNRATDNKRAISRADYYDVITQDTTQEDKYMQLDSKSKIIENKITSAQVNDLWENSNAEVPIGGTDADGNVRKEQAGLIVFDFENAEIRMNVQPDDGNNFKSSDNFVGRVDGKPTSKGTLIVGQIHTHPNNSGDGGLSFHRDPTTSGATGDRSFSNRLGGIPVFQLDTNFLDVENGSSASSVNNLRTNRQARSGSFNLGYEALNQLNKIKL